jgi:hypothetical protein
MWVSCFDTAPINVVYFHLSLSAAASVVPLRDRFTVAPSSHKLGVALNINTESVTYWQTARTYVDDAGENLKVEVLL